MAIKASDCFRLGSISKTHGVGGRLIIRTEHNLELAEFEEPVFVVIDGLPVPLFFEEITEKSVDSYIVKFEMIETPEKAKEFVGCDILAPNHMADQGKINFMTQVIGIEVHDKNSGFLGICNEIEPIPGNPLMIVDTPKGQLFIPLADEWVVEFVPNKRIILDCPSGLFNL
jgi:16S rRNA processing protein RimM